MLKMANVNFDFTIKPFQIRGYGDGEGHCVAVRHLHVSLSLCLFVLCVIFVCSEKQVSLMNNMCLKKKNIVLFASQANSVLDCPPCDHGDALQR